MAVRWGIIGCGHIANTFVAGAKQVKHAVLAGCAASDCERAKAFAADHDILVAYPDYQSLMLSKEIDAIYIATTHNFHFEQIKSSLLAGKHVLCEKPITLNSRQAMEVYALARQQNLLLIEAVWTRFLPAIIELQRRLNDGAIGKVKHVSASFSLNRELPNSHRLRNKALAGGALLDLGIYPITFADIVYGKSPVAVFSSAYMTDTEVDEVSSYLLKYEDGRSATLSASYRMDAPIFGHIYGENGRIVVPHFLGAQGFQIWQGETLVEEVSCPFESSQNFQFEIAHFQSCLEQGLTDSHLLSTETSTRVLAIMDDARKQWGLAYADE
ncbi:Gfo/Idh/MocA family protein [Agaribacter marinus]|uniref:Dehydrogenase n=1 Tax=Agaribacter marinus TaxID=1431249 RepID=A0AA37T407_9ALTE|nr:Gfo/Idh/MocA family oxidoreductase [Agaribacter marinus]GLR71723.1 dehydrogenase [Agaribacter marinus]